MPEGLLTVLMGLSMKVLEEEKEESSVLVVVGVVWSGRRRCLEGWWVSATRLGAWRSGVAVV